MDQWTFDKLHSLDSGPCFLFLVVMEGSISIGERRRDGRRVGIMAIGRADSITKDVKTCIRRHKQTCIFQNTQEHRREGIETGSPPGIKFEDVNWDSSEIEMKRNAKMSDEME